MIINTKRGKIENIFLINFMTDYATLETKCCALRKNGTEIEKIDIPINEIYDVTNEGENK